MGRNEDRLKIYFSGSIRGGRQDALLYNKLIEFLKNFGHVLTEHIGRLDLVDERHLPPAEIHDRDLEWLRESDLVIAEVTTPSLGVGYELGRAVEMDKPILCLYRKQVDKFLSGMISGSPGITTYYYEGMEDMEKVVEGFLKAKGKERKNKEGLKKTKE